MSIRKGKSRGSARIRRKERVRKRVRGSQDKPRLCVFKSLKYTYAQLIADDSGSVVFGSASSRDIQSPGKSASSVESAKAVGARIAEIAKEKKIKHVVFDRNGYLYHGRVAAVAEGAREAGLKF